MARHSSCFLAQLHTMLCAETGAAAWCAGGFEVLDRRALDAHVLRKFFAFGKFSTLHTYAREHGFKLAGGCKYMLPGFCRDMDMGSFAPPRWTASKDAAVDVGVRGRTIALLHEAGKAEARRCSILCTDMDLLASELRQHRFPVVASLFHSTPPPKRQKIEAAAAAASAAALPLAPLGFEHHAAFPFSECSRLELEGMWDSMGFDELVCTPTFYADP